MLYVVTVNLSSSSSIAFQLVYYISESDTCAGPPKVSFAVTMVTSHINCIQKISLCDFRILEIQSNQFLSRQISVQTVANFVVCKIYYPNLKTFRAVFSNVV